MSKKALLVVSFGTSYEETRKKTLDVLEKELSGAFPDRSFYRAWTSGMIIRKVKNTQGLMIDTVSEAMDRLREDGCRDLLVQPTHMLNGYENELMKKTIREKGDFLDHLAFGAPLLDSQEDLAFIGKTIRERFSYLKDGEALVLMGHGSPTQGNTVYQSLGEQFASSGKPDIFLGTVEASPDFSFILSEVKKAMPKKVFLAPFLIVAGDHAVNDLAGDEADSWKSLLRREGFETCEVLEGLGEYPAVREQFILHARQAKTDTAGI